MRILVFGGGAITAAIVHVLANYPGALTDNVVVESKSGYVSDISDCVPCGRFIASYRTKDPVDPALKSNSLWQGRSEYLGNNADIAKASIAADNNAGSAHRGFWGPTGNQPFPYEKTNGLRLWAD